MGHKLGMWREILAKQFGAIFQRRCRACSKIVSQQTLASLSKSVLKENVIELEGKVVVHSRNIFKAPVISATLQSLLAL